MKNLKRYEEEIVGFDNGSFLGEEGQEFKLTELGLATEIIAGEEVLAITAAELKSLIVLETEKRELRGIISLGSDLLTKWAEEGLADFTNVEYWMSKGQ